MQVGGVLPTTLGQDAGWGGKQVLIIMVALFTLGLVFVPAFAWRRLSQPAVTVGATKLTPVQEQVSA